MNRIIFEIIKELEKDEFFKSIKDKERFAEKMDSAFFNKKDIIHEIRKASLWLTANPHKRYRNYARFLVNWLSR